MTQKTTEESVKETLESLVIAFVLAFVFRAYVVEAFVIPTGSMAPTLLGQHIRLTSEQSGYQYQVDLPELPQMMERARQVGALDPMTGAATRLDNARVSPGDRILVLKYIYEFTDPKRWDVVVFKDPKDPKTNFIKRLVGLPNEQLAILDGNIYTRPLTATADADWRIARKAQRPKVQRAVWQPIYHSQYIPLDEGSRARRGPGVPAWNNPWRPTNPSGWNIENRRSYQLTADQGELRFDFETANLDRYGARYAYNQFSPETTEEQIEDIRLAIDITPQSDAQTLWFETTARLNDPHTPVERLRLTITSDGSVLLEAPDRTDATQRLLNRGQIPPLPAKQHTHLEWWVVDQQVIVWQDGDQILNWSFDLPLQTIIDRGAPPELPQIGLGIAGGSALIHKIELDRDLYYANAGRGTGHATAGIVRIGNNTQGTPLTINDDEFFTVGDNSPRSADGRYWTQIDPWVQQNYFPQGRDGRGIVPRKLLIGKAFFVYFPAYFPLYAQAPWYMSAPNFGDLRMIH
ncbi:signal peptidase I [Mucisphaera sp.]|uniref:signal peptidase I n=1 Tax=Mucisphaera sp. TaxID=2913024 RepID=UPI003D0DA041